MVIPIPALLIVATYYQAFVNIFLLHADLAMDVVLPHVEARILIAHRQNVLLAGEASVMEFAIL